MPVHDCSAPPHQPSSGFPARLLPWGVVLAVLFVGSLVVGRYDFDGSSLLQCVQGNAARRALLVSLITHSRLPRSLAAVAVGACLSVAGASYQAIFRNPLVSPDMLGASAGAALGASVGILLGFGITGVQTIAFVGGLGAVTSTWLVSTAVSRSKTSLVLILAGILVTTVFTSLLSLVKFLADPFTKLPDITFWLLGSLSAVSLRESVFLLGCAALGLMPLLAFRWKLNLLSLTDLEARSLGVNTRAYRILVIACATLITSAAVSICGLIGWVGLIVPHVCRLLFGPDYRVLLTASMVVGGIYLLAVDVASRSLLAIEVPLGIPIAILGAPFFAFLLRRADMGWN